MEGGVSEILVESGISIKRAFIGFKSFVINYTETEYLQVGSP